jgi:magnesium transporter
MPIVAGMGGNAGTQVLALMVRGLALGQIGASNVPTLVWKEVRVAMINGWCSAPCSVSWCWRGSATRRWPR